jgi:hypothetical protein
MVQAESQAASQAAKGSIRRKFQICRSFQSADRLKQAIVSNNRD